MLCHTERGGAIYAGGRPIETPFGTVYAGNLTPDAQTGMGGWSAAHFRRALHEGRSRDGRLLYPVFPYTHTTHVTEADADALFDYLRSLPPVHKPNRQHRLRWPYNTQAALAVWRALYFRPGQLVDDPSRTPEWNRGAYLVQGLGHCGACHTARNALGGVREAMDLLGGLIPMQNWYALARSPSEAAVADWPLDDVVQLLATGTSPRATVLGPMAEVVLHSTQYLEPGICAPWRCSCAACRPCRATPIRARYRARLLSSSIAARNCTSSTAPTATASRDRACAEPIRRWRATRRSPCRSRRTWCRWCSTAVSRPPRAATRVPSACRPSTVLSDADVAAVISYIRGAWGNRAAPVSELTVAQRSSRRE